MTTYSSPSPISAVIRIAHGDIRVVASERDDTVVTVAPTDIGRDADVRAAENTKVEFADGTLTVIAPRASGLAFGKRTGSVRLSIELPAGSQVEAVSGMGTVAGTGRLGDCRMRTGAGDIRLGHAATVDLDTGLGSIAADRISGDATCGTGSGSIRIGRVDGNAQVKNSNGETWIGEGGTAVRVKASNGRVVVERAHGDVRAASANGDLVVGSAERGTVELRTGLGRIDVGVTEGTAARLDLHSSFGNVVSEMERTDRPAASEPTVEISARTSAGDIVVRRSLAATH
ncbi:MAG: DUF4097 family beta strand repeat-containing protein [Actinomycetota bacterium]|nr:DUF4097 family beta strand repeat-containing protein [Actinomycetota bacterium]